MIETIRELISTLKKLMHSENRQNSIGNVFDYVRSLSDEINKIDPQDFAPKSRTKFTVLRTKINNYARSTKLSGFAWEPALDELNSILDDYGAPGSQRFKRNFSFICDPQVKEIVERDYYELNEFLFPNRAWKSTIIMAGSILEAVLFHILTCDNKTLNRALSSKCAPRKKNIKKGEWNLRDLIDVAENIKLITRELARANQDVIREYRNFIHPQKEIRSKHPPSEGNAQMAIGALNNVLEYFEKNL